MIKLEKIHFESCIYFLVKDSTQNFYLSPRKERSQYLIISLYILFQAKSFTLTPLESLTFYIYYIVAAPLKIVVIFCSIT